MKLLTVFLFATLLTAFSPRVIATPAIANYEAATPEKANPTPDPAPTNVEDEDFAPGLALAGLFVVGLVMIIMAFWFIVLAIACAAAFGLISLGILSTSVFIGVTSNSFSKGFRALMILGGGFCGSIIGAVTLFVINELFAKCLSYRYILFSGGGSGTIIGAIGGFIAFLTARKVFMIIKSRFEGMTGRLN